MLSQRPPFSRITEEIQEVRTREFALDSILTRASGRVVEDRMSKHVTELRSIQSSEDFTQAGFQEDEEPDPSEGIVEEYREVKVTDHLACDNILWSTHEVLRAKAESQIQCLLVVTHGEANRAKWVIWGGDHNGYIYIWNVQVHEPNRSFPWLIVLEQTHNLIKQWPAHDQKQRVNTLMQAASTGEGMDIDIQK